MARPRKARKPRSAARVRGTRIACAATQGQLAALLGVHWVTVARWEAGTRSPTPYQAALLDALALGTMRAAPCLCREAVRAVPRLGAPQALYCVLAAAYGDDVVIRHAMRTLVCSIQPQR